MDKCSDLEHDFRISKIRQQIRESSPELRELESQLRTAYVNKERAAQVQERKALRMLEKVRAAELDQQQKLFYDIATEKEVASKRERTQRMISYRDALNDQLFELKKRREEAFQMFMIEKNMIDKIVQELLEEDRREIESKMVKMKKTKEDIDRFRLSRLEWERLEQEKIEKENQQIEEYVKMKIEQEEERKRIEAERISQRSQVVEELAAELDRETKRKTEIEELRLELEIMKREEMARIKERLQLEVEIKKKLKLIRDYEHQLKLQEDRLLFEKKQQEEYKQQMLEELAEQSKLDQLTKEKQRQKKIEHRREAGRMLDEKIKQIEMERAMLENEFKMLQQMERARHEMIEMERERLLKQHASRLLGFIPKGVLRHNDLPLLGKEFVEKYAASKRSGEIDDNDI